MPAASMAASPSRAPRSPSIATPRRNIMAGRYRPSRSSTAPRTIRTPTACAARCARGGVPDRRRTRRKRGRMMRGAFRKLPGLLVLAWAAIASGTSRAESLLDAPVFYTATRDVTVDGRNYSGIVHHVAGKERQEQTLLGMQDVFILDGEAEQGWLVVPALKSYVAFPFPPVMAMLASPILKKTRIGDDVVDGIPTVKYRIHTTPRNFTQLPAEALAP